MLLVGNKIIDEGVSLTSCEISDGPGMIVTTWNIHDPGALHMLARAIPGRGVAKLRRMIGLKSPVIPISILATRRRARSFASDGVVW